jgi:hypothetical protein
MLHCLKLIPALVLAVTGHWLKVFPPNQLSAANVSFTTQTCAST